MNQELKKLEEILKRNSEDPGSVDIENKVFHYFFFDEITNEDDLHEAWSVFAEHVEIRKRLENVESTVVTIPGFGYRTPQTGQVLCDDDLLKNLVASHISNLRPLLLTEDSNANIISFIDKGFTVEIAPPGVEIPDTSENELFGVLYEAIQEYGLEHFPFDKPHYDVLRNWAIYLTKCDEVAVYVLWPCLEHKVEYPPTTMEPGAQLWKLDCRDRYWVKDLDYSSKTVYVRPPWQNR